MPDLLVSRIDEGNAGIVIDCFGVHRLQDRQIIDDLGRVWQQITDPASTLAVLLKRFDRGIGQELLLASRHPGDSLRSLDRIWQWLAMHGRQIGFVIPHVNVAWPT